MEPSPFIHGQESVTVDALDADDALRNREELQDTCGKDRQHAAVTGGFRGAFLWTRPHPTSGSSPVIFIVQHVPSDQQCVWVSTNGVTEEFMSLETGKLNPHSSEIRGWRIISESHQIETTVCLVEATSNFHHHHHSVQACEALALQKVCSVAPQTRELDDWIQSFLQV